MPHWGGGKKCMRCEKTVHSNEEVVAGDKSYHKRGCFTCNDCNKSLCTSTVMEHDGKIYCRPCGGRVVNSGRNDMPQK